MKRLTEHPMAEGESPVKSRGLCWETIPECLPATNALGPANGRSIAGPSKARLMVDRAVDVEQIRGVETYFQLALEFAKKARQGCATVNTAARLVLDGAGKSGPP